MKRIVLLCFCAGLLLAACGEMGTVSVTHLRCENLIDPQGLDSHAPRLVWEIVANCRNVRQTGYRVLVSSSLEKLNANEGDLWDSGEVKSDESVFVAYAGSALESRAECYWKAKVTTTVAKSGWSEPAPWTMGLLRSSDWQAQWTGWEKSAPEDVLQGNSRLAARYLRKEFRTENSIRKAVLYISGLGLYEAYINGQRVGDQGL